MQLRNLGASGLQASRIGLGALHFGAYLNERESKAVIDSALDAGVNFIDTAPLYGNGESEAIVGRSVSGRRDQVLIATKVGLTQRATADGSFGVELVRLTSTEIRSSVERSLKRMNTDYIDLLQLHAFDSVTPIEETLGELEKLVNEGKVRAVGCSNYDPQELETIVNSDTSLALATSQCHYNLIERKAEQELIPSCVGHGVTIICNRALARGILTGRYKEGQPPPLGTRGATSQRVRQGVVDEVTGLVTELANFAAKSERSATELALAWLLGQPTVGVVLIGARNVSQLRLCIGANDWNLTDQERATIDQIVDSRGLTSRVHAYPEVFFER